jgi:hypothetical protein
LSPSICEFSLAYPCTWTTIDMHLEQQSSACSVYTPHIVRFRSVSNVLACWCAILTRTLTNHTRNLPQLYICSTRSISTHLEIGVGICASLDPAHPHYLTCMRASRTKVIAHFLLLASWPPIDDLQGPIDGRDASRHEGSTRCRQWFLISALLWRCTPLRGPSSQAMTSIAAWI